MAPLPPPLRRLFFAAPPPRDDRVDAFRFVDVPRRDRLPLEPRFTTAVAFDDRSLAFADALLLRVVVALPAAIGGDGAAAASDCRSSDLRTTGFV